MTRNRRRKLDIRAATEPGLRYTQARHLMGTPSTSISKYKGGIHLCTACAQPAYEGPDGPRHFAEQEGVVFCSAYPAAVTLLRMNWDSSSLYDVQYAYESLQDAATGECGASHHKDRFRDWNETVRVCTSCGQPAFTGSYAAGGADHFVDQWDGVFCPWFPLAGDTVSIQWNPRSLADWKAAYVCTYPHGPFG
ncbi:hypothetical protein ACWD6Q_02625 [Streptomyces nigra]